jgi:lysophospholipase L1-like esterase
MDTLPKIAIGAGVLALLLFGSRARAQGSAPGGSPPNSLIPVVRGSSRRVTRGLAVGDSHIAADIAIGVLRQQTGAPWDNVAVVGANSSAVLSQAQQNLTQQGKYSHLVVLAGVNDGERPSSYTKTNLQRIYQLGKAMGAQVIAVTEMPWHGYSSWTNAAQTRQTEAVRWLTTQEGSRFADRVVNAWHALDDPAHTGYLDPRYGTAAGLHLNNDGQRLLGALILQAIRR